MAYTTEVSPVVRVDQVTNEVPILYISLPLKEANPSGLNATVGFEREATVKATIEVIGGREKCHLEEGKSNPRPLGNPNARPIETHRRMYFYSDRNGTERHLISTLPLDESCTL
jgi:hypothetical protein